MSAVATIMPESGANGPEVADRDPIAALTALREHGCVLLRSAVAPAAHAALTQEVETIFSVLEDRVAQRSASPLEQSHFKLGIIAPETLTFENRLVALLVTAIRGSFVGGLLQAYFRGDIEPHLPTIRARRIEPEVFPGHVPLHQDYSFLGVQRELVNCWMPLTTCGTDAPGLQLYPVRTTRLFAGDMGNTTNGYPMASLKASDLDAFYGLGHLWGPAMAQGDVLLFNGFCPHRSDSRPGRTKRRLSVEVRFGSGA